MRTPYPFQDLSVASTAVERNHGSFQALTDLTPDVGWLDLPVRELRPLPTPTLPAERQDERPTERSWETAHPMPAPRSEGQAPRGQPVVLSDAEVEAIRSSAHNQGLRSGREQGHAEGLALGEGEAQQRWQDRMGVLERLIVGLQGAQEELFGAVKGDLLRILTRVPEKILRRELQVDPEAIVRLAEGLLREVPRQRRLILKAHPEDVTLLHHSELRARDGATLQLEADPDLSRGDIVMVTDAGDIEATIQGQLDRYLRQTRAWLTGEESELPATEAASPSQEPAPIPSAATVGRARISAYEALTEPTPPETRVAAADNRRSQLEIEAEAQATEPEEDFYNPIDDDTTVAAPAVPAPPRALLPQGGEPSNSTADGADDLEDGFVAQGAGSAAVPLGDKTIQPLLNDLETEDES